MSGNYISYIIGLLIVLAVVLVLFILVDKLLKDGNKKVTKAEPSSGKTSSEKPADKTATVETKIPVMHIYNSELADDLNRMIKDSTPNETTRLKVENKQSSISKYIQSKNYESFNFANDFETSDDEDDTMKFTREDYKKFMALSNIDQPQ